MCPESSQESIPEHIQDGIGNSAAGRGSHMDCGQDVPAMLASNFQAAGESRTVAFSVQNLVAAKNSEVFGPRLFPEKRMGFVAQACNDYICHRPSFHGGWCHARLRGFHAHGLLSELIPSRMCRRWLPRL